jgi:asparagine synthase (glutamine-hydrolysing)
MCGIAGVFNFRSGTLVDQRAVRAMGIVMRHRGPDADDSYFDRELGLTHRRLAIIDLNERGRQPMSTPDGRFVIVYNGEVYNYVELRRELEKQGHTFRTDTDTEVVLTLFAREGLASLSRLNGMFTFAIWDAVERTLSLVRDRIGIKPLYYAETEDGIVFASEAKALFEYPGVRCELAESLIDTYMAFGYMPTHETLFRGVHKLLPAHLLRISRNGIRNECYWNLRWAPDRHRSADDTARELRELLLDSVRIHLRSDVPVGVFLSGGLDSSTTVALLAESGISNIKTFSVAYRESPEYDESGFARIVADRFGTKHHVLYVDPTQFRDFIPNYVWHMDEPVTEAAAISLYFVSKLLREHVTVALSGEGADELFGGYTIYRYMAWLERYRQVPQWIRNAAEAPFLSLAPHSKLVKYLKRSRLPLEQRYLGVHGLTQRHDLYTDDFGRVAAPEPWAALSSHYARTEGHDLLTRMLYTDLKTWLVDDLLVKADKMTMANSVELRVPFLDYRVVEFAATVPSSMKQRGNDVKWILKRAMAGRLPEEILTRPKVGFPTPLKMMFRQNMSGYLRDVLLSSRSTSRGFFRPERVAALIDEHDAGVRDHHQILWQLVVLEEWQQRFIDERRHAQPIASQVV